MKIVFRGLLCALVILNIASIRADLKQELVSLQQRLTDLAGVLKPSTGGTLPPSPEPTPGRGGAAGGTSLTMPAIFGVQVESLTDKLTDFNLIHLATPADNEYGNLEGWMNNIVEKIKAFLQKVNSAQSDKELKEFNELVASTEQLKLTVKKLEEELEKLTKQSAQFSAEDAKLVIVFLQNIQKKVNAFYNWIYEVDQLNSSALKKIRFIAKQTLPENMPAGGKFIILVVDPIKDMMEVKLGKDNLTSLLNNLIIMWEGRIVAGTTSHVATNLIKAPNNLKPESLQDLVNEVAEKYNNVQDNMHTFNEDLKIFLDKAHKIAEGTFKINGDEKIQEFEDLVATRKLFLDESLNTFVRSLQNISSREGKTTDNNSIVEVWKFLKQIRHNFKVFAAQAKALIQSHSGDLQRILFTYNDEQNTGWHHIDVIWGKGALHQLKPQSHKLKAGGYRSEGGPDRFADRFKKVMKAWAISL